MIKYGRYVKKVGYMDIRQKITQPTKVKNRATGEFETKSGSVDIRLYHAKKLIEAGFKSHAEAEAKAKELQGID